MLRGMLALILLLAATIALPAPASAAVLPQASDRFAIPATDDGLPGAGPIRRYDWFQNLWRERRSAWAKQVEQDQHAVVFLGDSITQGWGDGLGAAFPGVKVANRGISGDTTRGVLIRLQEDVLALHPAAVVLLIGTNDLEEGATPEVIAGNLQLIVAGAQAAQPEDADHPLPGVPELGHEEAPGGQDQDGERALRGRGEGRPAGHARSKPGRCSRTPDGDAKPDEFPDLLHPNEAGYAKWAAALRPVLATLGFAETDADEFTPEAGFVSLFNGRDLTGWGYRPTSDADKASALRWQAVGPERRRPGRSSAEKVAFDGLSETPDGRFVVRNGRLVVTTPPEDRKIQQLWTTREFPEDFILKLEFRATPNADSGVFVRGPQLQCRDYRAGRAVQGPEALQAAGLERDRGDRPRRRGRVHLQRRGARGRRSRCRAPARSASKATAARWSTAASGSRSRLDRKGAMRRGSRREFLTTAAAIGGPLLVSPRTARAFEASSRLKLGVIGCGGRGTWITDLFQQARGIRDPGRRRLLPGPRGRVRRQVPGRPGEAAHGPVGLQAPARRATSTPS